LFGIPEQLNCKKSAVFPTCKEKLYNSQFAADGKTQNKKPPGATNTERQT